LGGLTPLQSDALGAVALRLEATPMAVTLAWLLQRCHNILLMEGRVSGAIRQRSSAAATLRHATTTDTDAAVDLRRFRNALSEQASR
jgi:aryl-alcohol dehydrogenase-like predicted oxidoreductase